MANLISNYQTIHKVIRHGTDDVEACIIQVRDHKTQYGDLYLCGEQIGCWKKDIAFELTDINGQYIASYTRVPADVGVWMNAKLDPPTGLNEKGTWNILYRLSVRAAWVEVIKEFTYASEEDSTVSRDIIDVMKDLLRQSGFKRVPEDEWKATIRSLED